MAVSSLVDEARGDASKLAEALRRSDIAQVAQVVIVDRFGQWRLLLVTTELESEGRLNLARRLHAFLRDSDLPSGALERVELVGPEEWHWLSAGNASWSVLSWGASSLEDESIVFTVWVDPGFRRAFEFVVEGQIVERFTSMGYVVRHEPSFDRRLRADLEVEGAGRRVLIEIKQSNRKNQNARFRDMAGIANLTSTPVALVLLSDFPVPDELLHPQGAIPVCAVDLSATGIEGVVRTVESF